MSDRRRVVEQNYCGCCGCEIDLYREWCARCEKHIDPRTERPQWDRTHYARYGSDCPYQTGKAMR